MTTYLFPGQGSQVKGMGADLFDEFPELTALADEILGYSIKELCLEDPNRELNQTQFTQPALFTVNALAYQQKLKQTGKKPDFVAGHSLGEYNALQAAEAITFEQGLKLVKKRGELMSQAPKGAMAAILRMPAAEIRERLSANGLQGIDVANYNSPMQTVISGLAEDIAKAQPFFEEGRVRYIPLNTSGAFHSRYMAPVKKEFNNYIQTFSLADPKIPVISNVQAKPYQAGQVIENLVEQIDHSVNWLDSMIYLLQQGESEFEELGSGEVLTGLMSAIQEQAVIPPVVEEKTVETPQTSQINTNQALSAREKEIQALELRVSNWNKNHPVGTRVQVTGFESPIQTRSQAMILFGHRAAIYLHNFKGYFALDEVRPVSEMEQA